MHNFHWVMWFVWFMAAQPLGLQPGEALELRLRRDMGYAGGNDIQGTFTLRAVGPERLERVTFLIDGQVISEDAEAPFELRFNTGSYALGRHVLSAVGRVSGGAELRSNEITVNFVSASEGFQAGMRILGPMLAILLGVSALAVGSMFLTSGKLRELPLGAARQYGVSGGAICPRCRRPFPRHFFAPNLLLGKLERCPFCGKWSVAAAAPLPVLRQAEQAELKDAEPIAPAQPGPAEQLRRELDDSRYQDG